jgi:zinc/manganese transport system substrate-binding protein
MSLSSRASRSLALVLLVFLVAQGAIGCGRSGPAPVGARRAGTQRFLVVAAENFWGSLAAQLAGDRATVASIIVNPATDPHSYQPSTGDARLLAQSNMAIVNGLGYDAWASQLLRASPSGGRVILDVGRRLGLSEGANPHRWYYPADVRRVIGEIVASYDRLDPKDAAYFNKRRARLERQGLRSYTRLLAEIRRRYAGVPVGYSESIFEGLGEYLGLRLLTPRSFAKAVADGTDVTAKDKETVDAQASSGAIRVWIFNSQNVTPDVQRVNRTVRSRGIPVVPVTETLEPASAGFQAWQTAQLQSLLQALRRATGR